MKRKNIQLRCRFSHENWEYLQKEADRIETSVSAVLRQIIGVVFENKHYLQDIVVDNAIDSDNDCKNKNLTLTIDSQMKLRDIIFERDDKFVYEKSDDELVYKGRKHNKYVNRIYHADYVVSAYIKLIEADLI